MTLWQGRSERSKTGRKIREARGRRKFEIGREALLTTIGPIRTKKIRTTGGHQKTILLSTNIANVLDPKAGKTTKAEIKTVLENKANPHYVRRNIITKGAIIETTAGKA
ncbi:MAG TPA: 30S ribosomal protein S8e, partial [Thermoplasmatales archaeon]|nr:30S ribosomal protein S8e [Thermoplasmatales archaeon]HEX08601.1 30S ribosomal protein S8e [Thermoplasmatales archaeon]